MPSFPLYIHYNIVLPFCVCRVTRAIVKKLPLEKSSVDVIVTAKILNGKILFLVIIVEHMASSFSTA